MLSEQLTPEQREDAALLRDRLREPKVWAALERVMARMERDIFDEYERTEEKKAWLRGARRVLKEFLPGILERISDAAQADAEEEKDKAVLRGESAEGSSDLAL